jgi:hypothetical protein
MEGPRGGDATANAQRNQWRAGIGGVANASSFAATVNSYLAQAESIATGSSGQAQATAQTNFSSVNSVQTSATGQAGGAARIY